MAILICGLVKDVTCSCSTIKKARDEYVKRLNGIYLANLEKVRTDTGTTVQ